MMANTLSDENIEELLALDGDGDALLTTDDIDAEDILGESSANISNTNMKV
jgi:hypothetical protein